LEAARCATSDATFSGVGSRSSWHICRSADAGEIKIATNARYVPTAYALLRGAYPNVHIVKSYQPKFTDEAAIGTRKDQSTLLGMTNTSLAKLKSDETVKTIFAKYGIADALTKLLKRQSQRRWNRIGWILIAEMKVGQTC